MDETVVYTLPVVDEDGYVLGKPGRVLVQSSEITLRLRFGALEDVAVGEAVGQIVGADSSRRRWILPGGR